MLLIKISSGWRWEMMMMMMMENSQCRSRWGIEDRKLSNGKKTIQRRCCSFWWWRADVQSSKTTQEWWRVSWGQIKKVRRWWSWVNNKKVCCCWSRKKNCGNKGSQGRNVSLDSLFSFCSFVTNYGMRCTTVSFDIRVITVSITKSL